MTTRETSPSDSARTLIIDFDSAIVVSQGRILPLLGPAAVLYLIAEAVTSAGALDATALGACALALALSALPLWYLRRPEELAGARRVALLGVLSGIVLVRWARPELPSPYLDFTAVVAGPLLGVIVVQLASTTPDSPEAIARRRRPLLTLLLTLGVASSAAAALALAPAFSLFGNVVLVPPRWELSAPIFAVFSFLVALALRLARRRLGSTPEALAASLWAQLGLWAALATSGGVLALALSGTVHVESAQARLSIAAGLAALVAGHAAMLGARRQVHAGKSTRRVLASAISVIAVATGAAQLGDRMPHDPVAIGVALALAIVTSAVLYRALASIFARTLAPFGGRLLASVDEARERAWGVTSLEELGEAILPPLRRGSGALDAEPLLWTIDPPRQVRVDAAGVAHVRERDPSPAMTQHVLERPGEIVVSAPLAEQVVRRADLRGIVDALEREDALCVVPLSIDRELEGLLIVPRGRRRAALTLEEIDRLEQLGRQIAAPVALLCAQERARLRTGEAVLARERLEEELEAKDEELAKLRADARILKAGGAAERFTAPAIAYSPAMRALMKRVLEVGPLDAPVLLLGEDGTPLDAIGHLVHANGGRREGPFVVADCAAVRPERAEAALFGESAHSKPGWLRLAEGGTCLLLDVPALSLDAQAKLAEAIATRRADPADGAASYALDVRIVATSRVALDRLVEAGAFDLELSRRLDPLVLAVPPLRERREDVPSLVLLALDRSCRVVGRPVMGIDADALEVLVDHAWPGNVRELESVLERAVAGAAGPNVALRDLPPLAPLELPADPWTGTYAELEARILEHAIARAGGNKSEAARMLGLKRTTFLDKLKRHELLGPADAKKEQGTAA